MALGLSSMLNIQSQFFRTKMTKHHIHKARNLLSVFFKCWRTSSKFHPATWKCHQTTTKGHKPQQTTNNKRTCPFVDLSCHHKKVLTAHDHMLLTIHELESGQFAIQGCPTLNGHPGKCGKKQFRGENTTEMLAWGSRLIRSDREMKRNLLGDHEMLY